MKAALLGLLLAGASTQQWTVDLPSGPFQLTFALTRRAEVITTITARCDGCAWGIAGREAVMLDVSVDGSYSQHVPLVRTGTAEYRVLVGPVEAGQHTISVAIDRDASAKALSGGATILEVRPVPVTGAEPEHAPLSLAPIIHARPNTIGRFSDVPVFMWYETEPTSRGTRYRYTVIFTNEDGGTPADRLMATWGRTTDIEYVYSVEVDRSGAILAEDYQGPNHEVLPYRGQRNGRHPLLWVVTDNNMVRDSGADGLRYAPAPLAVTLKNESREAVMDANPWLYTVMTQELAREGKIVADAPPGRGTIPDPRRFVYLEACGEVGTSALSFALQVTGTDVVAYSRAAGATLPTYTGEWISSDRGVVQYRIVREGCFRAAIPLPAGAGARHVRALRAMAHERPSPGEPTSASRNATTPPSRSATTSVVVTAQAAVPVRLARINTVFLLDDDYKPGPSLLHWEGTATIRPGGEPFEIVIP